MLLDTSAWIEFFKGSENGKKVKEILDNKQCLTCIISISEIIKYCKTNDLDYELYIKVIENNTIIVNLRKGIVVLAGIINYEQRKKKNFGMIDALIYASARYYGKKVLTKDLGFKDLDDIEILS